MAITFYYAPMSSAAPTHWILEELGIPHEKVVVDLRAGDQKKPAFLKINPNGKVPVLVHDGVVIFESVAIAIHLGETYGVDRKLFPPPGLGRAEAIKWLVWCNASLGEAMSRYSHNTSEWFPAEQHNAKAAEAAKVDVTAHLAVLDQALQGKRYLLGDEFSLVDAHLASWVEYLDMLKFDTKAFPSLLAWSARCLARPAARILAAEA
jgi:glutathione S-transferase